MTGCFAIRLYGKRWLKLTKPHTGPTKPIGWRAMSWTEEMADAEKWATREAAQKFAESCRFPFTVVDLDVPAAPPAGGRIRMVLPTRLEARAA